MRSRILLATAKFATAMLLLLVVEAASSSHGSAQTSFEYVYGGPTCMEGGFKGVEPVDNASGCSGGGFIAVGYSRSSSVGCNSNTDIYVVRTNNNGSRMWEYTYDLGALNSNDSGYSIKELSNGTGFIITGTTDLGTTTTDAFLMKIDCDGTVNWATTYGRSGRNDGGLDVAISPPLSAPSTEDFIVCGYANNASGVRDAYLFRTDDQGNLLWDDTYDNSSQAEWFTKLIQAAPTAGQTAAQSDIVAVGTHNNGTNLKGYALRCSGVTGALTLANHGAGDWGLPNFDTEFNSVVQLANGNLVFVGYINDGAIVNGVGTQDIYLAETNGGKPTVALVQTQLGDNGLNNEVGYDIIRVQNSMTYTAAGNLVIVGKMQNAVTSYDVCMVAVDPTTLVKKLGTGTRFGDITNHTGDDIGYSIHEVNNDLIGVGGHKAGFIICGTSKSNLGTPSPVDPGDLYLIKTSSSGSTSCSNTWSPANNSPAMDVTSRTPTISFINQSQPRNPGGTSRNWPLSVCTSVGKLGAGNVEEDEIPAAANEIGGSISAVRSFPNPVKSGDIVSLIFTPSTAATLSISIADMAGKGISSSEVANAGHEMAVPIDTKGLAPGAYMVTVSDGSQNQSVRIIVQ